MTVQILQGDCRDVLKTLPDASVHCCVTSPPYFGLRSYGGGDAEIGKEPTPDEFVTALVSAFREVRRVLRDDGTIFLNLGDSYATQPGKGSNVPQSKWKANTYPEQAAHRSKVLAGIKPKDLIGIPWMTAFALRADGWYLRQEIIWAKGNAMPESVKDRCTKAHEQIFLLSQSPRYYFDAAAIAEPFATDPKENYPARSRITGRGEQGAADARGGDRDKSGGFPPAGDTRNKRSVWTVTTQPFSGAHFATMPPALVEPCILAGCPPGGTVLDPFGGAGTTALVADRLQRNAILIELNPEYVDIARRRITGDAPLFAEVA